MTGAPLTPKQVAFLRLHCLDPDPHAWEWQGNFETLHARRNGRPGEQYEATISREELRDLGERKFFVDGFTVSDAGRAALRAVGAL